MAQPFHLQSILLPLTGTADAASVVAVAAVGKITCACRHRRCGVGSSRWNINHAAVRPRVLSVGTTSPVIARTSNPLILDVPVSSGVFCVAQTNNTKIIRQNKNSNHFFTHHLPVWFLVQLPTITCALSASCASRTRVLGLESTDRASHSRSHCGVSADRQLHILSSYGTSIALHH